MRPFFLLKNALWGRKRSRSSIRLFVALLVLLFFLLITIQIQPFRQQEDNLVSTLANILLLCAFLGMGAS